MARQAQQTRRAPAPAPQQNGQGTAVAQQNGRKELFAMLERAKSQMAELLPAYMKPERMVSLVRMATYRTPKLLECDALTVVESVMQAARLGLEIGGPVPGAHLVPFRNKNGRYECQLIVDYRGLIGLAVDAGSITSGDARLVYRGERFRVRYGTQPGIDHEPDFGAVDQGPDAITHAYFVARLPGGEVKFEVMTRKEIDAIRARSKASDQGPWVTDYGEMAKKTVTKRGLKYIPVSPNAAAARKLAMAIELDNRFESGAASAALDWEDEGAASQMARSATQQRLTEIRDRIAARVQAEKAEAGPQPTGREVGNAGNVAPASSAQPAPSAEPWPDEPPPEFMRPSGRRGSSAGNGDAAADRRKRLNDAYFAKVAEVCPEWVESPFLRKLWQEKIVGKASCKDWTEADYERAIEALEQGEGLEDELDLPAGAAGAQGDDDQGEMPF